MKKLGQLKRINPREVWKSEASEFTPWLRENMPALADTLGLELDLIEREADVGAFSADLVAKDLNSDRQVVIENQLTATDHDHLGKLLTYAGNMWAGVVVWISSEFRDEHRQALEWLNQVTSQDIDFFGLQVEVLQVDDSAPAPNFSIVAKPSGWQKERRRAVQVTPRQQRYREFFSALLGELKAAAPHITSARSVGYGHWFSFSAGRSGFTYSFSFARDKRFRVELYIDQGERDLNKSAFDLLMEHEKEIREEVGTLVEWERLEKARASRIAVYKENSYIDAPEEVLKDLRVWAVDAMLRLRKAMDSRIKKLRIESD